MNLWYENFTLCRNCNSKITVPLSAILIVIPFIITVYSVLLIKSILLLSILLLVSVFLTIVLHLVFTPLIPQNQGHERKVAVFKFVMKWILLILFLLLIINLINYYYFQPVTFLNWQIFAPTDSLNEP